MKKKDTEEQKVLKIDDHIDSEQDLKNDEQIKEAVSEATPKEILESYLKDPVVKQNLMTTSLDLISTFRGNWFTIEQVMKKTHFKESDTAIQLLQMLIFSDFCVTKFEDNTQKFKITITDEDKVKELEKQVEQLEMKKKMLLLEIDRIKQKNVK